MTATPAALIACESALDPILEQLTMVLDKHSGDFAGPVAEAMERLRSTAADTSIAISAALLEALGPVPPRRRWALARYVAPAEIASSAGQGRA
jgi:class 3 adenylate cyclase